MPSLEAHAQSELLRLAEAGLLRALRPLESPQGTVVQREGRELINFSSNDYLGLTGSERLREAFQEGIHRYGTGSGASRFVCGDLAPHEALEEALVAFKRTEAALAFSSGYATSVGVIPALVGAGDTIILDKLCHASLIDGARLSGATIRVFPHNHMGKLEKLLASLRAKEPDSRILIITESIFSMDGDAAPLRDIVELKDRHGAWLMVDEAHSVGVLGPQGRGLAAALGVEDRIELQMGTLSKALGVSGGYVACTRRVHDLILNKARSLIYSTAPPPAVAFAAIEAVRLAASEEGDRLREKLTSNREALTRQLQMPVSQESAILPFIIGDEVAAMQAAATMLEAGFLIPAIRFPTVARGSARLRLTLSAAHEPFQIERLVACLLDRVPQVVTSAKHTADE